MSDHTLVDPLALWRGIDDAVAREAVRRPQPRLTARNAGQSPRGAPTGAGQDKPVAPAKLLEPV